MRFLLTFALLCATSPAFAWTHGQYIQQAQQFFARVPTLTDPARLTRYNAMISSLVSCPNSAGNVWSLLDALWIFDAPTSTIALTNVVQSAYGGTNTGNGATFTALDGFIGTSNATLSTNFTPSTAVGANYQVGSASFGVYVTAGTSVHGTYDEMGTNYTGTYLSEIETYGNGFFSALVNDNNFANIAPSPSGNAGFYVATAVSPAVTPSLETIGAYYNGEQAQTVGQQPSGALDSSPFTLFYSLNSPFAPSDDTISAAFIGGYLNASQVACLSSAINTFLAGDGLNLFPSTSNYPAIASSSLSSIFSGHASSTLPLLGVNSHLTVDDDGVSTITPTQQTTMLTALHANFMRIDATDWAQIEPTTKGTYVFTGSDPTVNALIAASINVDLLIGYSNTLYEACIYTGPTDSTGKTGYANYANAVATQYGKPGIYYEFWNEENIGPSSGCSYAWSPSQSAADYSTLATGAATTIGSGYNLIVGGLADAGANTAPATYAATVQSDLTWTNFVGLGLHPYTAGVVTGVQPEQSITDSAAVAAAATSASGIYWNEVGYQVGTSVANQTQQGIYDARLVGSSVIAQAKAIGIYEAASNGGYGLFNSSFVIQPPGTAVASMYAALNKCTGGVAAAKIVAQSIWQVSCTISGGVEYITWAEYGAYQWTQATGATITGATATDVFGNSITVTTSGANATFNVVDSVGPVILSVTN